MPSLVDEGTWSAISVGLPSNGNGNGNGLVQWAKVYDGETPFSETKFPVPIPLEHRVYGEVAFKAESASALLVLTIGFTDPDGISKGEIWTPFTMVIPGVEYSATSAYVTLDKEGAWVLYATLQEGAEILDSREWCAIDAGKEAKGFPWKWVGIGAAGVAILGLIAAAKNKKKR